MSDLPLYALIFYSIRTGNWKESYEFLVRFKSLSASTNNNNNPEDECAAEILKCFAVTTDGRSSPHHLSPIPLPLSNSARIFLERGVRCVWKRAILAIAGELHNGP